MEKKCVMYARVATKEQVSNMDEALDEIDRLIQRDGEYVDVSRIHELLAELQKTDPVGEDFDAEASLRKLEAMMDEMEEKM